MIVHYYVTYKYDTHIMYLSHFTNLYLNHYRRNLRHNFSVKESLLFGLQK